MSRALALALLLAAGCGAPSIETSDLDASSPGALDGMQPDDSAASPAEDASTSTPCDGVTCLPSGPVITDVAAINITQTTATITWTLNEPGTGQVNYGTTTSYGLDSVEETSFNHSGHAQDLAGLSVGTLYHFRVRSSNQSGRETVSGDYTFTTLGQTTCSYPPDVTYSAVSVPAMSQPALLSPVTEPSFGTQLVYISSTSLHAYAKAQVWNADQTLIGLGVDMTTILDGTTYQVLRTLPWGASETRWSHQDPNKMFGEHGNLFVSIDATTGATTTLHAFTGYSHVYIGPWEGNLSIDDKYVVLVTSLDDNADIIVYDLEDDLVIAQQSLASMGYTGVLQPIDWASMSPSGEYVVILAGGFETYQNSVKSYRRDLTPVATVFDQGQHGDLGFDSAGNEVFVQVGTQGGPAWMSRLSDGHQTAIFDSGLGQSGHMSCRNVKRPGWCYLSMDSTEELLAIKLDGSQTVERFAHYRSQSAPLGVASPDGTRIMFQSDWDGTTPVGEYVVGTACLQ